MSLPFTPTQFFDLFDAYNRAVWPVVIGLWVVTAWIVVVAVRAKEVPHRALSALLAFHWVWSGVVYHALFFTRINPAAWLFAGLFLVEGVLLAWLGLYRGRLRFAFGRSRRERIALALIVFSLAYPAITFALESGSLRAPLFAVPCPTTILTMGLLLAAERPRWTVAFIPLLWALVGGSAALLLDVRADLALFAGAALLIAGWLQTRARAC